MSKRIKDRKIRFFYNLEEKRRASFLYLVCSSLLSKVYRSYLMFFFNKYKKYSHVIIKNRCVLSNRPRAVFRRFRMSRHMLKKHVACGNLVGVMRNN